MTDRNELIDAIVHDGINFDEETCLLLQIMGFVDKLVTGQGEKWAYVRQSLEGLSTEFLHQVKDDPNLLSMQASLMTEHFLPDYHHWGDVSTRVEEAITVPIRRVPHVAQWTGDPPFDVLACSWQHTNEQGILTQRRFERELTGAIEDFTNTINRLGEFKAYPLTYSPPTVQGVAYHDWKGGVYPFDLRAVVTLDEQIEVGEDEVDSGLKFHLVTLIEKEDAAQIQKN